MFAIKQTKLQCTTMFKTWVYEEWNQEKFLLLANSSLEARRKWARAIQDAIDLSKVIKNKAIHLSATTAENAPWRASNLSNNIAISYAILHLCHRIILAKLQKKFNFAHCAVYFDIARTVSLNCARLITKCAKFLSFENWKPRQSGVEIIYWQFPPQTIFDL
jgi:hypothetical protein